MDPEQGLLIIVEYLAVECQVILLRTFVGMLCPKRIGIIHQFGTLGDL